MNSSVLINFYSTWNYWKIIALETSLISENCGFSGLFISVYFIHFQTIKNSFYLKESWEQNLFYHPSRYLISKVLWDPLTLLWWRSLSCRIHSIDLLWKSMDWFPYDRDLRHEKVKASITPMLFETIVTFFNLYKVKVSFHYTLKTFIFLFFQGVRKRIRTWNGWNTTQKDEKISTWYFFVILDQGKNGLVTECEDSPALNKGPETAVIRNILWHCSAE